MSQLCIPIGDSIYWVPKRHKWFMQRSHETIEASHRYLPPVIGHRIKKSIRLLHLV